MKYLKYILGVITVLVLIFLTIGFMSKSISYDSEVTIERSAEEVWSVMQDEATLPDWIEGYQRSELISGDKGKVGAVSKVYVSEGGQESVMQETIKELVPHQKMTMLFEMEGFMDMDYEIRLDDQGDKTVLTSTSITRGDGVFARAMVFFMQGGMKKQEDKNMAKLKSIIEGR